ncbi:DUF3558 domain-containing protein [Streptomyces sp. AM 2-1-1]|uniref:DUF3558 domain-containing protein n=1 Tax=unclassified Streptomyces TaxID=2593676 RepID=UPI0023B8C0EF|nr:DUF3558 domain-containing protein [Streptomyces sp. AM 2-1-1]WEH40354.1 DUF3558 domain-containing protein [Streptomyces sp. AM 2-1-1]
MAYVPGIALLAALVAGCTGSSGTEDATADAKPGGPTVLVAPPGKYRTLPEACRSVSTATLEQLLPGVAELPEEQREKVYEGRASVTYDTDRKAGCTWRAPSADSTRTLVVDFERVVSYDPSVSDEDSAAAVYGKKAEAAGLPAPSPSADPSSPSPASPASPGDATASPSAGDGVAPQGSTSPTAPASLAPSTGDTGDGSGAGHSGDSENAEDAENTAPRTLDHIGNAAFLNDSVESGGSTAQRRTVSVVFRTSNVLVTVRYAEQAIRAADAPESAELQEKAQALARGLDESINE